MCYTGLQLGGGGGMEEGASPAFFENRERNPDFGKKKTLIVSITPKYFWCF